MPQSQHGLLPRILICPCNRPDLALIPERLLMPGDDSQPTVTIQLKILGDGLVIERDGEGLAPPTSSPAQHLLALFAVKKRYADQELVNVLWPGDSLGDAFGGKSVRERLNRAVSDARGALGVRAGSGVLKRQNGITHRVRNDQVTITTDFDDFERLRQSEHADDWRAALALVRGPVAEHVPSRAMNTAWIGTAQELQKDHIKSLLELLDPHATTDVIARRAETVLEGQWSPDTNAEASAPSEPTAATRPAQADASPPHRENRSRYRPRWPTRRYIIAGIAVALLALALSVVLLSRGGTPIPPEGSVINAETGAIISHPQVIASHYPAQIGGGAYFRACDLAAPSCGSGHHGPTPLKVKVGDVVAFRVSLNDGTSALVHSLKVEAFAQRRIFSNTESQGYKISQTELEIRISVMWPGALGTYETVDEPDSIGHHLDSKAAQDRTIYLQLPRPGHYGLAYIPGSTTLVNRKAHFFHYLPNGIVGYGIELEDVGPPRSCFWCAYKYIRYVYFHARVTSMVK